MSEMGAIHVGFCVAAIPSGAVVLLIAKGTRWHRTWGHLYAVSMLGVIVSALLLYERNGRFGPFHVAALVGAFTLAGGLHSVLARRPRRFWMEAHATWMSWSYIGLIAALVAESMTRYVMPLAAGWLESRSLWGVFWGLVVFATVSVVGIGAWFVRTKLPAALARTPDAMRRERQRLRSLDE